MAPRSRPAVLLLVLALAGLLAWLALRPSGPNEAGTAAPEQDPAAPRPAGEPAATSAPVELATTRDEAPAAAPSPSAETAAAPADDPPPVSAPDLAAREWIVFRVVDIKHRPIAGAEIELFGMRRKRERGSIFGWRGDPSIGKTGEDGALKLAYPTWTTLDDETAAIALAVRHPDYTPHEDQDREIAPEIEIVLEPGSVVVISGWIGDPTRVITDVTPTFSWDVRSAPEDWIPRRDGRLTSTRVQPGYHLVALRHEDAKLGTCFSEIVEFQLEPGEHELIHLELLPARKLVGRLDDEVPRPVVDGTVVVAVQRRTFAAQGSVLTTTAVPVRPDGTFEVTGLQHGQAQLVALCKGWASTRVLPVVPEDARQPADLDPAEWDRMREGFGDDDRINPPLRSDAFAQTYVIDMEPTATLELSLKAPDGSPASGVTVNAWPNACWIAGACGMFLDNRTWTATSDSEGLARIPDIPAGEHNFGIEHPELDLPLAGDSGSEFRMRRERYEPGATLRLEIQLARKP